MNTRNLPEKGRRDGKGERTRRKNTKHMGAKILTSTTTTVTLVVIQI